MSTFMRDELSLGIHTSYLMFDHQLIGDERHQLRPTRPAGVTNQRGSGRGSLVGLTSGTMHLHQLRLGPGHDLLEEINNYCDREQLQFAVVISAVGSLSVARIRPAVEAGASATTLELAHELEIVSLAGLLAHGQQSRSHLHLAVADSRGKMTGGHLKPGSLVRLGATVVLGSSNDVNFGQPKPPS